MKTTVDHSSGWVNCAINCEIIVNLRKRPRPETRGPQTVGVIGRDELPCRVGYFIKIRNHEIHACSSFLEGENLYELTCDEYIIKQIRIFPKFFQNLSKIVKVLVNYRKSFFLTNVSQI